MVATPIGNLADVTVRALHVLALADAIACEDTRHTAQLLRHYGIDGKPLIAVHEHNEREAAPHVIARLQAGQRVACVSDAGTPAVSDPGARLVQAVRAAGLRIVPLPGPSSAVAALSVSGDEASRGFRFVGFLPAKPRELEQAVQALDEAAAVVIFEAPHRIEALGRALAAHQSGRTVTVCRELTKQFEEIETLAVTELPAWLAAQPQRRKGEFVLVLHSRPASAQEAVASRAQAALEALVAVLPLKQAVALAAEVTGASRNALYELALQWKREGGRERQDDRDPGEEHGG